MKEPVKIESNDHYNELLEEFKEALLSKIPEEEGAHVDFIPLNAIESMSLQGNGGVKCVLNTETSGRDVYLICVDRDGYANFVRSVE